MTYLDLFWEMSYRFYNEYQYKAYISTGIINGVLVSNNEYVGIYGKTSPYYPNGAPPQFNEGSTSLIIGLGGLKRISKYFYIDMQIYLRHFLSNIITYENTRPASFNGVMSVKCFL